MRWTTPLGLPVVQPYRKFGRQAVSTEWFNTQNQLPLYPLMFMESNRSLPVVLLSSLLNWVQIKTSLQTLTLRRETETVIFTYPFCLVSDIHYP